MVRVGPRSTRTKCAILSLIYRKAARRGRGGLQGRRYAGALQRSVALLLRAQFAHHIRRERILIGAERVNPAVPLRDLIAQALLLLQADAHPLPWAGPRDERLEILDRPVAISAARTRDAAAVAKAAVVRIGFQCIVADAQGILRPLRERRQPAQIAPRPDVDPQ